MNSFSSISFNHQAMIPYFSLAIYTMFMMIPITNSVKNSLGKQQIFIFVTTYLHNGTQIVRQLACFLCFLKEMYRLCLQHLLISKVE